MCAAGAALTAGVWGYDGKNWKTLLSALVGMAVGGAIIWTVRNIGRLVLGQEAMGFGDVTLMCMFGAFLGWQACLIVFFLAPFAALYVGPGSLYILARQGNSLRAVLVHGRLGDNRSLVSYLGLGLRHFHPRLVRPPGYVRLLVAHRPHAFPNTDATRLYPGIARLISGFYRSLCSLARADNSSKRLT